ncbi:expressed unknown protein [Seminavis robusta]|uniref:Uncharacterized protein n=1 Tax=Seminavis robusta TaxID=568900 RepID=A0A9N8DSM4_9STRA|nr:expressed unknown protein [Seminavis robusta]|eukprot:Sro342_g121670.1 n/a (134) ;mRNA; r:14294-14695
MTVSKHLTFIFLLALSFLTNEVNGFGFAELFVGTGFSSDDSASLDNVLCGTGETFVGIQTLCDMATGFIDSQASTENVDVFEDAVATVAPTLVETEGDGDEFAADNDGDRRAGKQKPSDDEVRKTRGLRGRTN